MRITKFLSALFLSSVFALSSVYATNVKITALTEETAPITSDILVMVDDPAGTPVTEKVTFANLFASAANVGASTIVTTGALNSGSIATGFGNIDNGTSNITSGGIWRVDVDGTGLGAAGALGFGAGPDDGGWYWDGTNLIGTSTADMVYGADGNDHIFHSNGVVQTTLDDTGINIITGNAYSINAASVLNATTLGSAVVTSSLTTVGALASGSIASGFGAIDNNVSNITTGGILKVDVDGTAINAAGSWTYGAGNDAAWWWDGSDGIGTSTGGFKFGVAASDEIDYYSGGTNTARFDWDGSGSNTAMFLLDPGGTLQRVLVGNADSAGGGFRTLMMAN